MPEKAPWVWWDAVPAPVKAMLMGTVVALLRVMYDDKEPRMWRRILESALCGAIALGVALGAEELGASVNAATFAGGMIGLFGADQVRIWGRQIARSRIGTKHER